MSAGALCGLFPATVLYSLSHSTFQSMYFFLFPLFWGGFFFFLIATERHAGIYTCEWGKDDS